MNLKDKIYYFFWKVSGEDPQILKETKKQIKNRFLISGVFVLILFLLSVFSYHHSFNKLFHLPYVSWVISFVFTMMIINIYRLNIITLAPNEFKYSFGYIVSLIVRILFILLISLTVIKPLETIFLNRFFENEVNDNKEREINDILTKTNLYYDREINNVEKELLILKNEIKDNRIIDDPSKILYLNNKLQFLKNDKKNQIGEIKRLLNESTYFIKGLIIINKNHKIIWLLTFVLIILFLTPFLLKFTTSPKGFYSRKKIILQNKIIEDEYKFFKSIYPKLFKKSFGKLLYVEERYDDPPFNTIRKKDKRKIGRESDFINHLYGYKED